MNNDSKNLRNLMKNSELKNLKFDQKQRLAVHRKIKKVSHKKRKLNLAPYLLGIASLIILFIFWQPYLDQSVSEAPSPSNSRTESSSEESSEQDVNTDEARKTDLEEVLQAFENEAIQLTETDFNPSYKLQIKSEYAYKLANDEQLYIYTFNSVNERKNAVEKLKEQTALIDTRFSPLYYSASNLFVVHMSSPENNKDIPIKEVMSRLNGK